MKLLRITLLLSFVIAAALFVATCNGRNGGGGAGKKPVIAVIPKGVSHFFWQSVKAGADAAARDLNVTVDWQGPASETDFARQVNIVEDAINRHVDAIVLAPAHGESLVPVVERAARAGIPVTIFDSGIKTENYVSYVATDNYKGGVVAAERMAEKLGGKGKVAILGVTKGGVSTDERENGFRETIEKKYPDIKIVQHLYGEANMALSLDRATDILQGNPDLNGLFASNESSIVGADRAVRQKGAVGKVVLVGFDATSNLVDEVKAGAIDSLVLQNPYKMGYEGVKTVVTKLNKQDPPRRVDTGVSLLTKENVDTPEIQALIKEPGK
ncbi:MAG TPA: substrate-binding domain-containing protein [Blastocatellia bacterium]|nr:substrate-binding domain-containing protein [Blastocatellia bacterium]